MQERSLVDILQTRAQVHGERPLYQQIINGEIVATLSYAQADRRARALAVRLRAHTKVGNRVLLLYPFGLEYPAVFLACLYAGVIAVPAFPPDKQRAVQTMPRVSAIIRDADARLILTTAELAPAIEFARAEARDPAALQILASDAIPTDRVRDEDLASLDLSSWKLTVSGAEPLRASTIERFCERFAPAGFRPETFMPCFGMAEATLMVSGWPLELAPKIRWFDKAALATGRAEALDDKHAERARPFVSCGTPMREHHIAIVDPCTHARLPEGHEGEIWLRGPSVGRGYWGDEQTSTERFAATIQGEDPETLWFRTADTGFVVEGELYGSGRLADLIVIDGRSYQPHDIERSVCEGPDPLVRECVTSTATNTGDGQPIVCLAGTGRRTMPEAEREQLCERIFARVREEHGLELDDRLGLRQGSIAGWPLVDWACDRRRSHDPRPSALACRRRAPAARRGPLRQRARRRPRAERRGLAGGAPASHGRGPQGRGRARVLGRCPSRWAQRSRPLMQLRFHPLARVEYVEALVYLEQRRAGYGERFETEVGALLDRIRQFPHSGTRVPGLPSGTDVHAFPLRVFRYTLMVGFDGDDAVIYALSHQHRRPGYWRDRV